MKLEGKRGVLGVVRKKGEIGKVGREVRNARRVEGRVLFEGEVGLELELELEMRFIWED